MHNLSPELYEQEAVNTQPWLERSGASLVRQQKIQDILTQKAGARFGTGCYVAEDARVFTNKLMLGDRSWIASGAIVRGDVMIDAECSVNPYAHLAGNISIGRGCRIASMASIYGFNHGISSLDVLIKDQPGTSKGVKLHEDVWVGASAVILDGVEIGPHCVVAAGAVVAKSFGAYQIIAGNPARSIADRRTRNQDEPKTQEGRPGQQVRRILFDVDPYENLERSFPEDLQGWGADDPIFRALLVEVKPNLIVEVGTWKGASAVHMADICKKFEINAEIVCIDTWLGNWQHWARPDGIGSKTDLKLHNGLPMIYYQFLSNVVGRGHSDIITPLPLTGVAGAKLFAHYGLQPDLVYIDGDHEYETVIFDLRGWLGRVAHRGILFGDDYQWPGVRKAVNEIAAEGNWTPDIRGNKFILRRNQTLQ